MSDEDDSKGQENSSETEINASLASLDITVKTEGKEECEQLFYNVWEYVVEDAEEMTESMRDRLSGSD